jgi:hypothetical protein
MLALYEPIKKKMATVYPSSVQDALLDTTLNGERFKHSHSASTVRRGVVN